jgi:hypothetical protein
MIIPNLDEILFFHTGRVQWLPHMYQRLMRPAM